MIINKKVAVGIMPYIFFYAFAFMAVATFSTFINIYFKSVGFSKGQIGTLAAIGPAVSMLAQPLWGILSDRTNQKRVLLIIIAGAAITSLLYSLNSTLLYIALVAMLYHGFNSSIGPLGDALTLQFLRTKTNIKFSSVRLVGTVSYALMAAVIGRVLSDKVSLIFFINSFMLVMALLMALWMPIPAKEEKTEIAEKKEKTSILLLFQNKILVIIFLASLIVGLTLSFHNSFVGLRMEELGAGNPEIGLAMFLSAASEIPVLLFIHKIFNEKKPVNILMFTGFALSLRMFLVYAGTGVGIIYASQLLNGFTFMVPYYFSVLLVDKYAPDSLKSSAQSVYAVFRIGAAATLGNIGGGYISEIFGIRGVYLILAVISFSTCFVLPGGLVLYYKYIKQKN